MDFVEVNKQNWTLVEIDPENKGYTEMIIEKCDIERDVMWSPDIITNPLVVTPFIPYQARFDYNIYLKIHRESNFETHKYSIVRMK